MKKMRMKQSTLNTVMGVVSAALLLIMILDAIFAMNSYNRIKENENRKSQASKSLNDYQIYFNTISDDVASYVQSGDKTAYTNYINEVKQNTAEKVTNKLQSIGISSQDKGLLKQMNENFNAFRDANNQIVDAMLKSDDNKAKSILYGATYETVRKIASESITKASVSLTENGEIAVKKSVASMDLAFIFVFLTVLFTVIFSVLRIFLNKWAIINPLIHIKQGLLAYANGDMSAETGIQADKSEIGQLAEAMHIMKTNIQSLLEETEILTKAAVDGKLSYRANASEHAGEYGIIVGKINSLLDTILAPVKESYRVLEEVATGNLCVGVEGDYAGDHAKIKDTLNGTINSLNEIIYDFNIAAEQVSSSAKQVSEGSQELSQGATEQASSIEELNATITEIAAQTRDNALKASSANVLVLKAKSNAEIGNDHMKTMLKSMNEINEASKSISKIIGVIDEIAFKTNILALNAAVEAARAGQYGKGFAVVADEVKNLAEKSAGAARETAALIEISISKVESGTVISKDTAKTLADISEDIVKTVGLVGDIASASNEQASAIAQLNKGIEQVAHVVQENSATAEEAAAASEELSSQAEMLKLLIAKFILKEEYKNKLNHNILETEQSKNTHRKPNKSTENRSRIAYSDNEFGKY